MGSAANDPYVIVHGGVVKTASSYLQAILQRNAGRLRKQGVHYVHHRTTRKEFTVPCQLNGYEKLGIDRKTKISDKELAKIAKGFFDDVGAKSGERIILSDENLSGHSGQCARGGMLFANRKVFTRVFANNIPFEVREVHLAVRNYADFFASTYIEFLRSASARFVIDENAMKRKVLSNIESWSALIQVIAKSFPDAKIIAWRHEDMHQLSDQIIQNLVGEGADTSNFATPQRKRIRPSASQKAVEILFNEIERFGAEIAIEKWAEIQEKYPRSDELEAYDPWTQDERRHLTHLYESDVQKLTMLPRIELLRP
ncbi:hypothetical protein OU789_04515 [Halocynthiibacter sp. C4]|uniref:hypothetical protein n=1 Tax=Halocynthiibacter sp. C4 TaxID=2992758 RepID=UPI00237B7708|nr:hypothetical protein [Halocynthiibacter sp. C4]MDE0589182.1 hypothetical protein [Halocynthiibacter sp. C4]